MGNEKTEKNKPSSFDDAQKAARERDAARKGNPPGVPPTTTEETAIVPTAVSNSIAKLTPTEARARMDAALQRPGYVMAPQIFKLEPGMFVEGKCMRGLETELEKSDGRTGEIYFEKIPTWIIEVDGLRLALLETSQLKKKLPPYEGGHVMIYRCDDIKGAGKSGGDVADYVVIGEETVKAKAGTEIAGTAATEVSKS